MIEETDDQAALYDIGYKDCLSGETRQSDNPSYDRGYVAGLQFLRSNLSGLRLEVQELSARIRQLEKDLG